MTTLYKHTLTVACPESMFHIGNCLAALFGECGAGDMLTFRQSPWQFNGVAWDRQDIPCKETLAGIVQALSLGQLPPIPETLPAWMLPADFDHEAGDAAATLAGIRAAMVEALEGCTVFTEPLDAENLPAVGTSLLLAIDNNFTEALGFEYVTTE